MFRALRHAKIVWSAVALLGLLAALAWLLSPPPLRAAEPALPVIAQSLPQELVPLDDIIQVAAGEIYTFTNSIAIAETHQSITESGNLLVVSFLDSSSNALGQSHLPDARSNLVLEMTLMVGETGSKGFQLCHLSGNRPISWVINVPQVNWVSFIPTSGQLAPTECDPITATFNAAGLEEGVYDTVITFTHNADNDPVITVVLTVIRGDKPVISQVKPKYEIDNTRFLEGIQVVNPIVAHIDWAGLTPDRVEFKLNGKVIASEQTGGKTAEHTLDMGFNLDDGLNRLEIIAYGKDKTNKSRPSDPQHFQFYSIALPTWMAKLTSAGLMETPAILKGVRGKANYDMGFQIPVAPFTIDALRIGPPDGTAKFEWDISGKLSIPIECVSTLSASLERSGSKRSGSNIKFLRSNINLSTSGALEFRPDDACGFQAPVGVVTVKGTYKGQVYSKPVLVMVTYFNVAVGQTVDTIIVALHLERFVGKFGEFYIDGSLGLEANATIDFAVPAVKDLGLGGDIGITGGFRSDLRVVEVNVYAGAGGGIAYKRQGVIDIFNLDRWQFDKLELKGEVGAKFRVFWYVHESKGNITWTYPAPAEQLARLVDEIESSDWRLIPHPVRPSPRSLQLAPGAALAFATDAQRSAADAFTGAQTTVTSTLVANVYPYPDTTLAVNPADDQAIVVWTDVDDAKPLGQAQELFFSRWDGTAWQPPAAVTDDNLLDGAPQVAWASDGQAVALWHRSNTPLAADASLSTTVTQQIDIATAVYSPTTRSWGPVAWLTTNAVLDATPQLARSADGELLAAWRRNSSGLLSGDADAPDQIVAAFYQNGWQPSAVAVDNIPGLLEFAVGMGASSALNTTAQIAYTQDVTPTGGITPTAQIFLTTWDGNNWSAPQQLTDDEQTHRNLQILYTLNQIPLFPAENEALLLWLADDQLKVRNLTTESTQTLPLPADILGVDEFRALLDANGNIAVVFANTTLPRNLYLVYYDKGNQLWGTPRQLTHEEHSLKFLAPAFDSTGRLLVAYARTAIAYEEQVTADEEPITYTIPVERQTDLVTLSHLFDYNLKITDADLSFARSETAENQVVISATVHNDSDKAVRNVRVDFYRSDPAVSGVWFGSAFISDPMPGNTHTTVTTNYAPSLTPEDIYVTVTAVDIVESNKLDNQARLLGIGADLELVGTEVAYGPNGTAVLRSEIRNNGYSDVYEGALVYTLDSVPQPLAQQSVSVTAGEITTVTTVVDLTPLPAGVHPMTATVGLTNTTEFTSADNQITASLYVLPDLTLAVEAVAGHEITQTSVTISATVRNTGAAPSVAVPVRFYSAGDLTTDYLLGSEQLVPVSPDGAQTLTIQLPGPLCQLYAVVDPDNTLDELSKSNNVAAILLPAEECAQQPAPTATTTTTPTPTPTATPTPTSQPATPTATPTPTPVTTVIAPNQGGSISGQVGDLEITAQFPAGAHANSFTVSLQPVADPPTHGDLRLLGQVFSLTAKDGNGQPVTQFGQTFTITVYYSGNDWADLSDLSWSLFYWSDTEFRWIEVPTQQISAGTFETTLDNLTNFALLEAPPQQIYLPAIQR